MGTAIQAPASTTVARHSPEHAVALVAPAAAVVLPTGHAWQLGVGTVELPPAEKVPMLHSVQLGPPVPALQMRTAEQVGRLVGLCGSMESKLCWHGAWITPTQQLCLPGQQVQDMQTAESAGCKHCRRSCVLQRARAASTAGGHAHANQTSCFYSPEHAVALVAPAAAVVLPVGQA
jgi:hypothetical protein